MPTILTVTANPLLDHLAEACLRPGTVNRIGRFTTVAGGKGLNVGRVLARHGHRVIAAAFAGGETGAQLGNLIAADGMEPLLAPTQARTRVGFLTADPAGGGATSLLEDGFPVTLEEAGFFIQRLRAALVEADLVIVGGSVPDLSCRGLYRTLLDACQLAGKPCWVDAYGPAMDEALAGTHPPLFAKPNRGEYGDGDHRRWTACTELHLSDGPREIRVRHPKGRWRVVPPPITEINPVGSGDCYVAALAHARLSGRAFPDQLRYAAAAGAANAARLDVARIAPADIEALAERVQVAPADNTD
jgi:tagatose 6-phosphate kinase